LFLYYKCEEQKGSVGGGKLVEGGGAEDLRNREGAGSGKLVEGGAEGGRGVGNCSRGGGINGRTHWKI